MTDETSLSCPATWAARPLCVAYLLFVPGTVSIELLGCSRHHCRTLHWALGILADGSWEVLGVWPATDPENSAWDAARSDLSIRGVEEVQYVATVDGEVSSVTVRRHHALLEASQTIVLNFQSQAVKAASCHGPFGSIDDAVRILTNTLERAERLLGDSLFKETLDSESGPRQARDSRRRRMVPASSC